VLIGEVVGTVVATQKDEKLRELKMQVVRELDDRGRRTAKYVVAIDSVGAGIGDRILFCTGSSARQTKITDGRPADAVIMAIIDSWDVDGELVYSEQRPVANDA
jgi:microcompartment protein CcmK/EutM